MILLLQAYATAQPVQPAGLYTYGQAGGYVSTDAATPFWLKANQWGRTPTSTPTASALLGLHYDSRFDIKDSTRTGSRSFSWGAGVEGVLNAGADPQALLPEAYAKVGWKFLELIAGRRREVFGVMDTTLTSGSYSWAGNALPIPKVQIRIADYVSLPFLHDYVGIKGTFSHGWFNTPYIQKVLLHQKNIAARFGPAKGRFHLFAGLNHHATWGGEAEYLLNSPVAVNGKLTRSFQDFIWGILLGKLPKQSKNDRYTVFDGTNRVGNHVGHYDLAMDYRFSEGTLLLYHQHPFEDASGLVFRNFPDGLYGLSWKPKMHPDYKPLVLLRGALLEWFYSKSQSGETFVVPTSRFMGNDNYFNHGQYREGWSYFGRGLGTPFITPRAEIREDVGGAGEFFPNNSVVAYHMGVEALVASRVLVRAKVSYSQNFGNHNIAFNPEVRQLSSLVGFELPAFSWGNTRLIGQVAYDRGDLYPKAVGMYLGLRTTGWSTRPAPDILHRLPF
ncbi:capsule assembly Wzi family protein [Telluribacter humicola]